MTRITQFILGTRDDLEISTFGEDWNGFGFEIREGQHHRVIIDCGYFHKTREDAEARAKALIKSCQEAVDE